jgi:hypothetical protein
MRRSWPYRIAAGILLIATLAVDLLAKLGPLGAWSAAFDVTVNVLLIAGGITAVVIGERRDQAAAKTEPDNDY